MAREPDYNHLVGDAASIPRLVEKESPIRMVALIRTSMSKKRDMEPELYLGAIAEMLFLTIVGPFIITYTHDKVTGGNIIGDNPIKNMIGYNNPCAFWDQPPALYFAAFMFCPMVYMAIRYAQLDTLRAEFDRRSKCWIYKAINILWAVSQCVVMGIFVVPPIPHPHDDMWKELDEEVRATFIAKMRFHMRLHSACFVQLIPCIFLAIAANYLEGYMTDQKITKFQWIALGCYAFTSLMETTCATYAVFAYQGDYTYNPDAIVLPPNFMMCVDWLWFLSLPVCTSLQPHAPNILITVDIVDEEGAQNIGRTEKSRRNVDV